VSSGKLLPIAPTVESVRNACKQFDGDIGELALKELFDLYRDNDNHAHVLLKVVALNRIYSAGILAVYAVADHIYRHAKDIDSALAIGAPEIVDTIAKVTVGTSGKAVNFWSFASKYCSWHKPTLYPLWDSRVDTYLRSLRHTEFGRFLPRHGDLWNHYAEFVDIMRNFREHYKLGMFTFKEIDMFIWSSGGKPIARETDEPPLTLSAGAQI
jgi:hypothetical protein